MSDKRDVPADPRPLGDDELEQVSGGIGYWNAEREAIERKRWKNGGGWDKHFDEAMERSKSAEDVMARRCWLKSGSQYDQTWYFEDGLGWFKRGYNTP